MTAPANARGRQEAGKLHRKPARIEDEAREASLSRLRARTIPGSAATETPQIVCEEVTRRSFNRFFLVAGAREGAPILEVPGVNEVRMLDATGRVVTSYGDIIYEPRGTPESSGATLRPANSRSGLKWCHRCPGRLRQVFRSTTSGGSSSASRRAAPMMSRS